MISDSVTILPHSSHADIIFEYKSKLYKCQVKTASKKKELYLSIQANLIEQTGASILGEDHSQKTDLI